MDRTCGMYWHVFHGNMITKFKTDRWHSMGIMHGLCGIPIVAVEMVNWREDPGLSGRVLRSWRHVGPENLQQSRSLRVFGLT
jgi:hypothetical protein